MRPRGLTGGFTLMEVLLVIAIATVITAAGTLGLSRLQAVFKLRSVADEIRAQLQLGRELAIANKDQVSYQVSLTSGIVLLKAGTAEIARYQSPVGINFSPGVFTWGFAPLTGQLTGCPLPCQLTLTASDNVEVVTISANGMVN